jgi:hypothetical protein
MSKVFNIPLDLIPHYADQRVIVRASDPALLTDALREANLEHLVAVQLLSIEAKPDPLAEWGNAVPVDLVLNNPAEEYPLLYRFAKLLDKHPIRASIPAVTGFSRAVKVAASLSFAVKLDVGQIGADVAEELLQVLNLYLHHTLVTQPIEFFHSTLEALYHQTPTDLWDIQGENPEYLLHVMDDRFLTVARRAGAPTPIGDLTSFIGDLRSKALSRNGECLSCEFFDYCGSYFKWPRIDYDCVNIKRLFGALKNAASELGRDVETFDRSDAEVPR